MELAKPQFISLEEHAADLAVSIKTVRNKLSLGTWPAKTVLLGNRRLVPVAEHDKLVAQLLTEGYVPINEQPVGKPRERPRRT